MFAVEVLVGVVVLVGVAFLASGAFDPMSDEEVDRRDTGLPTDRPLTSDDIPRLRFGLAFRGYRMRDVDDALQRMYDALRAAEVSSAVQPSEAYPARGVPDSVAASVSRPGSSTDPYAGPLTPPAPAEPPMRPEPAMPPVEPPMRPEPPMPPVEPPMRPDPPPEPEPRPEPPPEPPPEPVVPAVPPVVEVGDAVEQPPAEAESMPLSMLERLRHGDHNDL